MNIYIIFLFELSACLFKEKDDEKQSKLTCETHIFIFYFDLKILF